MACVYSSSKRCSNTGIQKPKMLISALNPPLPGSDLPVGFQYANGILAVSPTRYILSIILHGVVDKYALNNEAYNRIYGVDNPFLELLQTYRDARIKLYVCDFCLKKLSPTITDDDILTFITPVPFSLNFIYDAENYYDNTIVWA